MFVLEKEVDAKEWEHAKGMEVECTCGGHLFDLCINDKEDAWLRCTYCGLSTRAIGNALATVKEALLMCFETLKR